MPTAVRRLAAVSLALVLAAAGLIALAAAPAGATVTPGVAGGTLTVAVNGDDDFTITCTAAPASTVSVDDGTGNVLPSPPACSTITDINVTVSGSFDNVFDLSGVTDEAFTGLVGTPPVTIDGGGGNDVITGSEVADTIDGGDGNDRLIGFRGADTLNGEVGDDTLVWNNGDGSDIDNGGDGTDTVEVNGGTSTTNPDVFTAVQKVGDATRVTFERVSPGPFSIDIGTSERLDLNMLAGDDTFTASQVAGTGGLAETPVDLDVDGGEGNDEIKGGDGADLLAGGAGNDTITGFRSPTGTVDTKSGGDGNDVLIWNNGDGTDAMDGGTGSDTIQVNGSAAAADTFTLQPGATAGQMRFDRTSPGPFGLDITTSELLDLRDAGTVGPDAFTITGTAGADTAVVSPDETSGLGIATRHTGIDQLTINTVAGDDRVTARAGAIPYTIDGGDGIDVLTVNGGGAVVSTSTIQVVGSQPITNLNFEHVGFVNTAPRGYWVLGDNGSVTPFGTATSFGNAAGSPLTLPIVGGAATPSGQGYWLVARDGGIFSYGDATFFGSTGAITLNQPIVGMAATPTGLGYWFVAADGGVFSFGDAEFFGSTGNITLNQPIVGMASTPTGQGYWLVATDGGIFSFGDAEFFGSTGSITLNQPIVGMSSTLSGDGYWFVAADGGIFSFGDAEFFGSTGNIVLNQPIVGMAASPTGEGYWFIAADGGVFNYGDATYLGSAVGTPNLGRVVGLIDRAI
jgi:Ca2+-binding RTX toxin-like protein